jgi:YidC/Oxa1 family membrane protein insertase
MALWQMWTDVLQQALATLASHWGLSQAMAVIMLTMIVRVALMPVSLGAAWRMQRNKDALQRLQPALAALKQQYASNPRELSQRTLALYREHGVRLMDRLTLANLFTQTSFGIAIYQVINRLGLSGPWGWIANIAKPDVWLTVLVTVLMLLGMALMPGATADTHALVGMLVALVVSAVMVATLPSALGLYWATSNAVGLVQTLALRRLRARRAGAGSGR